MAIEHLDALRAAKSRKPFVPFKIALSDGHEYVMADYNRNDLIFTKEMLLADPIVKTPLRNEGE